MTVDADLRPVLESWIQDAEPVARCVKQLELTERVLRPHGAALLALFEALRAETDADPPRASASEPHAPYPVGRCREISEDVLDRLRRALAGGRRDYGSRAVGSFLRAGGRLKPIWGVLRNRYFQSALQLGTLYVDVANDTVDIRKPKVEILPFDRSGFEPVRDVARCAEITERYWGGVVHPNTVLPELAPVFPFLWVHDGVVEIGPTHRAVSAWNILSELRPARRYLLETPEMPAPLRFAIARAFARRSIGIGTDAAPAGPSRGRLRAACDAAARGTLDRRRLERLIELARGVGRVELGIPENLESA